MGTRRKARESALQMLFAAVVAKTLGSVLTSSYWSELSDLSLDEPTREFADKLTVGTLRENKTIDERIRTRAEHWRIERMAIVDRNVLRLAVYEFLFEETPHTVIINEALEIARRFSTFEATQFINGILDAIKHDLAKNSAQDLTKEEKNQTEKTRASSNLYIFNSRFKIQNSRFALADLESGIRDILGRGTGFDAVKDAVEKAGGAINVQSQGRKEILSVSCRLKSI